MAIKDDIKWFKGEFGTKVQAALDGTPLTLDLVCAIALQETGYIWRKLVAKGLSTNDVLRLCVGDTIDAPRRSAFPTSRSALTSYQPHGQQMFDLAHSLLVEMAEATGIASYIAAAANASKFCHGYGIFQRDLQFFKDDPDYFLNEGWGDFDRCLNEAIKELKTALSRLGYANKSTLTDRQLCYVAIVYNTGFGNFNENRGLKQGFEDEDGVFYGEYIARFISASRAVPQSSADAQTSTFAVGPEPRFQSSGAWITARSFTSSNWSTARMANGRSWISRAMGCVMVLSTRASLFRRSALEGH
jgi:hypothetical protein